MWSAIAMMVAAGIVGAPVSPPNPAACAAKGGYIQKVCMRQAPVCLIPFKDAGKPCTDKSQCQGRCLYNQGGLLPKPGIKVVGACQRDTDPCGCKTDVIKGKTGHWGCVD